MGSPLPPAYVGGSNAPEGGGHLDKNFEVAAQLEEK